MKTEFLFSGMFVKARTICVTENSIFPKAETILSIASSILSAVLYCTVLYCTVLCRSYSPSLTSSSLTHVYLILSHPNSILISFSRLSFHAFSLFIFFFLFFTIFLLSNSIFSVAVVDLFHPVFYLHFFLFLLLFLTSLSVSLPSL